MAREPALDLVQAALELGIASVRHTRRFGERMCARRVAVELAERARDPEVDISPHADQAAVAGARQRDGALEGGQGLLWVARAELDLSEDAIARRAPRMVWPEGLVEDREARFHLPASLGVAAQTRERIRPGHPLLAHQDAALAERPGEDRLRLAEQGQRFGIT